jgi:RNA polymerase sigma-70 factor, ECF subfamily
MKDFDDLYRSHLSAVYRTCMRYVGRSDVAEEIAGEVFLALYQQLESLEDVQLPAWLFTVAKRKAIDYWRRQQHERRLAATEYAEPTLDAQLDIQSLLARCTRLTPAHRACLLLRYMEGMSRAEIAAQTGLDEMQVKAHLQYALKLLKDELVRGTANGLCR